MWKGRLWSEFGLVLSADKAQDKAKSCYYEVKLFVLKLFKLNRFGCNRGL